MPTETAISVASGLIAVGLITTLSAIAGFVLGVYTTLRLQ